MAIGNLNTGISGYNNSAVGSSSAPATATTGGDGSLDSLLGSTLNGLSSLYGSQNAAQAQNTGILNGITTQQQTMGNINSLFSQQTSAGNNALTQLQALQGGNGQTADYSNFNNSPGYQFAIQQGTNAIQSAAAANGSAYTPNTLANLGNYVTGTASQNYNNYVSQLLQTAGIGAQGNSALSSANLTTGGNISQLQQNSGNAQASGVAGSSSAVGSLLSGLLGGNSNGSGLLGSIGKLVGSSGNSSGTSAGGIGNILNGSSSLFGGGTNGNAPYSDYNAATGTGTYSNNSLFSQYGANNGYDPTTGTFSGNSSPSFDSFSNGSGYDPTTGNYDTGGLGNLNLGDLGGP